MSDMGDRMIDFEEQNYDTLVEKFIDIHRDEWEQFVCDRFCQDMADIEPPDRLEDR